MTYLENTTNRLLHPVYTVPGTKEGEKPTHHYLNMGLNELGQPKPGVLPGCHDIDDATAELIQKQKGNRVFFDTGMLKLHQGSAPKIEMSNNVPAILRVDARAIGATKRGKKI